MPRSIAPRVASVRSVTSSFCITFFRCDFAGVSEHLSTSPISRLVKRRTCPHGRFVTCYPRPRHPTAPDSSLPGPPGSAGRPFILRHNQLSTIDNQPICRPIRAWSEAHPRAGQMLRNAEVLKATGEGLW